MLCHYHCTMNCLLLRHCCASGRCYSQVADGIDTGQCLSYNSDVLSKTSSHIWGRWYLHMFLFRDGSLTLMSIASLIALMRFWIKKENRNNFLQHLNSIHPNIKFTCEEMKENGSMPFLDILITPAEDGSLKTSVYRKQTHTDLYLQWDSHHNIPSEYSVASTLYHRANTICSDPTLLHEEEQHLFKALSKCKYPIWAIHRAKLKSQNPNRTKQRRINNQKGPRNTNNQNLYMMVPYHQGLSERVKKHAANMGYRYISKEDKQSKASLWLPRTRILLPAKVESYTDINAMNKGVEKNT